MVVFMVSRPPDPFDVQRVLGDDILKGISSQISPHQFETWFRNLPIQLIEPDRVVIMANNRFSRNWLDSKFREVITRSARNVLGVDPRVEILVSHNGAQDYCDDPQHPPPDSSGTSRIDRFVAADTPA